MTAKGDLEDPGLTSTQMLFFFLNLLLSPNKLLIFRMTLMDWQFSGLLSDFQIHQVIGLKQKRNRFYLKVQTLWCLKKYFVYLKH